MARGWEKLRLGRRAAALLLIALGAAGCLSPPHQAAQAGYLAASGSSVAFLRWPASGRTDAAGTLELIVSSGTAPGRSVSVRSYPFTARLSGGALVMVRIEGRIAHGQLSGRRLVLGPLPGSTAARTFGAATAESFSRALAALRDRVRRSDALARRAAAGAALRRQQVARAVAGLITAAMAVRQARRVISSRLESMASVTSLAAGALAKTRRDAAKALVKARLGARRVLVCDYAVVAGSDAVGVSAYSAGLGADIVSLGQDLSALRVAITDLAAQRSDVLRQRPGYAGGGLAPTPVQVEHKISQARRRIPTVLTAANGYVDLVNHNVASAYRLSARASNAGTCRSAAGSPAPLPGMR